MTWGWVNDDCIFILGWTSPLKQMHCWVNRLNIWEANICGSLTFSMFWNTTPYKIRWSVMGEEKATSSSCTVNVTVEQTGSLDAGLFTYLCFNQHAPVRSHFTRLNKRDCCTQSLLTNTSTDRYGCIWWTKQTRGKTDTQTWVRKRWEDCIENVNQVKEDTKLKHFQRDLTAIRIFDEVLIPKNSCDLTRSI